MSQETFATAITCMDGRIQESVRAWVKQRGAVDFVDMVTEAGPDKVLNSGESAWAAAKKKSAISVEKHGSKLIVVVAHYDCAGNPVDRSQHEADVRNAINVVQSWEFPVEVLGIYVDENWRAQPVT